MTKDLIEARILKLTSERDQIKATLLAYEGALQEANFWLSEANKTESDQ